MMNCQTCKHKTLGRPKDGWCYMFKEKPEGNFCGQENTESTMNIIKKLIKESKRK